MKISHCSADIYFFQADKAALFFPSCSHHSHLSWRFHNSSIMKSQATWYCSYNSFRSLIWKSNKILTFAKSTQVQGSHKQEISSWSTSSSIVSWKLCHQKKEISHCSVLTSSEQNVVNLNECLRNVTCINFCFSSTQEYVRLDGWGCIISFPAFNKKSPQLWSETYCAADEAVKTPPYARHSLLSNTSWSVNEIHNTRKITSKNATE